MRRKEGFCEFFYSKNYEIEKCKDFVIVRDDDQSTKS